MTTDSPGQAGVHQGGEIDITDEMILAGVSVWKTWEESDEPDVRVMVRDLLAAALSARAASSS